SSIAVPSSRLRRRCAPVVAAAAPNGPKDAFRAGLRWRSSRAPRRQRSTLAYSGEGLRAVGSLRAFGGADLVELAIDRPRRYPEELRREGLVPLRVLQRLLDDAQLDLGERRTDRKIE